LRLADLVAPTYGHRALPTYALTAFLSWATGWNLELETAALYALALGRLALLWLMFRALLRDGASWAVTAAACLVFSAYHYLVWLSGVYSVWHFVSLFGLGALTALVVWPVGWRALMVAVLCALAAAFSQASGLVVFPVLTLTLPFFGYRKPAYYVLWGGALVATFALYLSGGATESGAAGGRLSDLLLTARFSLAFLGNPFTYALKQDLPIYVGGVGLALLVANLAFLAWRKTPAPSLGAMLTLAGYGGATALLVYLGRYTENRFIYAIEQRYAVPSTHFWLAWVLSVAFLASLPAPTDEKRMGRGLRRALLGANLFLGLWLAFLYAQANLWNWQTTARRYERVLGEAGANAEETCVREYVFSRQVDCLQNSVALGSASPSDVDRLAYYRLSLFRGATGGQILPPEAETDAPVLLDVGGAWFSAYLGRWWLADFPHQAHLLAPPEDAPVPPVDVWTASLGELGAFWGESETVWYLRGADSQEVEVTRRLAEAGYRPTVYLLDGLPAQSLTLIRYERAPRPLRTPLAFGGLFQLVAWRPVFTPTTEAMVCTVRLQTWWVATQAPPTNFGLSAALSGGTENASGLSPVPTLLWEVGTWYLDERLFNAACDTADFQVRLFNPETGESLGETRLKFPSSRPRPQR
jgi:hypothetical protein